MRKELFYVAASRGRESITVVTSDKGLLRESVARSDVRLSASELSHKAQDHSSELPKSFLRVLARNKMPNVPEHGRRAVQEGKEPSRKVPAPDTSQTINRDSPSCEQKQEHLVERGPYLGISH
jgi:hypothetical protein